MHLCTCRILLGGDALNVLVRGEHAPVSWPEVGVLQFLHGEESVSEMKVCGEMETTRTLEKERLITIYGRDVIELVYPGRAPALEMEMPGVKAPVKGVKNPKSASFIPPIDTPDEE